jgi:16S rRNA (cytosine1402-N4)-methyltransferase
LHRSVLLEEVLAYLDPKQGDVIVDATVGSGGHAEALLEKIGDTGYLIGLDQDEDAIKRTKERLGARKNVLLIQSNFRFIDAVLKGHSIKPPNGILFDLGVSSDQLESPERGFSFLREGPLDMRMDSGAPHSAADLVNALSQSELEDLFYRFGEERQSRRIAKAIVAARARKVILSTTELAGIVARCFSGGYFKRHPATRVFQALRIAVNQEFEALKEALEKAVELLCAGGRLAVISFHSLEDRLVKSYFREASRTGRIKVLTKKVVMTSKTEVRANPRARSAKLRAAEKAAENLGQR